MTHAEVEALENSARVATVHEAGLIETPLPRKVLNGITGLVALMVMGVVLLILMAWRSH